MRKVLTWAIGAIGSISIWQYPVNAADQPPYEAHKDIPYVADAQVRQKLDIYVPKSGKGPFPVVMWIHGGGWVGGDKFQSPCDDIIKRGWAAVSVNYRLANEGIYPAQIQDCKAAVRFIRAHASEYNLDPDRIAAWGESSGGHLVALLATTNSVKELEGTTAGNGDVPGTLQAAVNWNGPANLATIASQATTPMQKFFASPQGQITTLLGGPVKSRPELAALASPVNFASADDYPMLIVHGEKDEVVPTQQSVELYERLQAAGAPVKLELLPNGTHNLETEENRNHALDYIAERFNSARSAAASPAPPSRTEPKPSIVEEPTSPAKD